MLDVMTTSQGIFVEHRPRSGPYIPARSIFYFNINCLQSSVGPTGRKRNTLILHKRPKPLARNSAVMHEVLQTIVTGDESVSQGVTESFYRAA